MSKKDSIRRSMLWAAYGDSLGFITELCSKTNLSRRTGGTTHIKELIPWKRRVGGKFGVQVDLRKGCYSDDTQLRLATCRSITGNGHFDVETFSKVELPVWLSYALGAGTGSKVAAGSLRRNNVRWNSNFFSTDYSQYINGGGNGAAMRIQPHVLSSTDGKPVEEILRDVIRNTITTHGHARAIIGAAFHAFILYEVKEGGRVANSEDWLRALDVLRDTYRIVESDEELGQFWLPHWENEANQPFKSAINQTVDELAADIRTVQEHSKESKRKSEDYSKLARQIGCLNKNSVGSAPKTALLAAYLSHRHQDNPHGGIVEAANLLGSDTDTIATMVGAVLGAVAERDPPERVMDYDYVIAQADRLHRLSEGHEVNSSNYPDLLYWRPPSTQVDTVAQCNGSTYLVGIGKVASSEIAGKKKGEKPYVWRWLHLELGQTVLAKTREMLKLIDKNSLPVRVDKSMKRSTKSTLCPQKPSRIQTKPLKQKALWDPEESKHVDESSMINVDRATDICIKSQFDEPTVGKMLMELAKQENAIEKSIAFASIIAKAKQARIRSGNKS